MGLRHVLESGLALIRDEPIEPNRRATILNRLIEIFSEAERGSQAVQAQNLLFATEQRPDFERFSVFFHYLDAPFGATLPTRLRETEQALGDLRDRGIRDQARLQQAGEVIEKLLSALKRDAALTPLEPLRDFRFG